MAMSANGEKSLLVAGSLAKAEAEAECRICKQPAAKDRPLVAPCDCRGTVAHQHMDCLLHWVTYRAYDHRKACELCGRAYNVKKRVRPVWEWSAPALSVGDKKKLFFFSISYVLAAVDLNYSIRYFLLPLKTRRYRRSDAFKLVLLLITSTSWMYIFAQHTRFFRKVFRLWMEQNTRLTISLPSDSRPSFLPLLP